MSNLAIRVEHLSKRYRIGQREQYYALRDAPANAVKASAPGKGTPPRPSGSLRGK